MVTVDPFALELVKSALESLSDEMAITIMRTARSSIAKESFDFSTAVLNTRGELVAVGLGRPLHLGMVHVVMGAVMSRYPVEGMEEGDIYALNDPYEGGTHLPDIYLIKPVFVDSRCAGFVATCVHHVDIGGRVPGGNASDSTEIYQEGLRLPPLKLFARGVPDEAIFRIVEKNVRVPEKVIGDLHSQASACRIGERGLLRIIEKYGLERYLLLTDALLDYTERVTRAEIRTFPDGVYEFHDYIDGDGIDSGPIRINLSLIKKDDTLTADFTGTAPQVKGSINPVLGHTYLTTVQALRCAFNTEPPVNAGYLRAITVKAPLGSFTNPRPPAAVAARGLSMARIEEVVWGAMSKMLPDKVFACSVGVDSGFTFAGRWPDGRLFVFMEFLHVSWGGRPNKDGIDALTRPGFTFANQPVEVVEAEQPLMIEEYSIPQNTGGAGKFRGGMALNRAYRLVGADEAMLQLRTDRQVFLPYGLAGGKPGTPSRNVLNPGREDRLVASKDRIFLNRGDTFFHTTAGSAGWGPPVERDPQKVLEDVRNEKMTVDYAEREYGVVIDRQKNVVDHAATRLKRDALKRAPTED